MSPIAVRILFVNDPPAWDAPDLSGRTPADLCHDAPALALLRHHSEAARRNLRARGGTERPNPSRLPGVLPTEWRGRLNRIIDNNGWNQIGS